MTKKKEIESLNNELQTIIKDNFNNTLNYFVPSFGNKFFERIIKYKKNLDKICSIDKKTIF